MICKITKKKIKPFMTFGQMPIANEAVTVRAMALIRAIESTRSTDN